MTNTDYFTPTDSSLNSSCNSSNCSSNNNDINNSNTGSLNCQNHLLVRQVAISTSPETSTIQNNFLSSNHKKRKLLLHFDQHNTIQVACTLPGRRITVEEGLNNFLTSVVWGKEVVVDSDTHDTSWQWVCQEPRLTKPVGEPDAITYFKYLEKKVVKAPEDRARLKQLTCRFVHEEPGSAFKEFFDLYLESLIYQTHENEEEGDEENDENLYYYTKYLFDFESCQQAESPPEDTCLKEWLTKRRQSTQSNTSTTNNGLSNMINKKLPPNTIPAGDTSDRSIYHLILPEFFDMIRRLQKANREFAIILRTMGIDSHNFLETIKPMFEGKHRDFRDLKPLKINTSVGQIKRSSDGSVSLHMDNEVYSTDEAIYAKLSSLEGISAIRDDFAYWQANEYSCYAAKPLWIDLNDQEHQHIIFDDNIRLDSTIDDCIVNIRLRRFNSPPNHFESIDFESYSLFDKSSILQPNLIKLLNPHLRSDSQRNHYYDLVRRSEFVYDRLLEEREQLNIVAAFSEQSSKEETTEEDATDSTTRKKKVGEIETDESIEDLMASMNKMRRNSDDIGLLTNRRRNGKLKNLKLNRSFSMRLEEAEKEVEKENVKSILCVIT